MMTLILSSAWRRTPRPIQFAVEISIAAFIAVGCGWLAAKTGLKLNAKANGDVRAGWAAVENAQANEQNTVELRRIADALERAYPPHRALPRPSLLVSYNDRDIDCRDSNGVPEVCR